MSGVRFELHGDGDWGHLVIDRPETRNALDGPAVAEFRDAIVGLDPAVRLVVLTSADARVFLSGADLKAMLAMSTSEGAEFARAGHSLCTALEQSPAVVAALVNGYALGGGTEIALACDVVVATEAAVFGLPEVTLGIFPGWGGTQRLVRGRPPQSTLPYLLSARRFDADEAYRIGVATVRVETVAEAEQWFEAFAAALRRTAPRAVAAAKRVARDGLDLPLVGGLELETEAWTRQFDGPDRTEGIGAFLEKREVRWEP